MADTSYLKQVVEPFLLHWTSKHIGVALVKRTVPVGKADDGRIVPYEFDGVSPDGTVGVCISASSSYKTGQMRKFFMEATLLNRVPEFRRRIMVFTDDRMRLAFCNQCDGLADLTHIEFLSCTEMPSEMKERALKVCRKAADEVGDKSGREFRMPRKRGARSSSPADSTQAAAGRLHVKDSKKHPGAYLYWWDISPSEAKRFADDDIVVFRQKDTGCSYSIPWRALRKHLTPGRRTSRGSGNWGIRVRRGHENELALEPPGAGDGWIYLPAIWV
jgi:hypothetical protein